MSSIAVLAGFVSTVVFAAATLPMLRKAAVTRDLDSYSLGNIGLANVGNAVHSVYVFHLPPGPIWVLHGFYVLTSALMLFWYVRYAVLRRTAQAVTAGEETGDAGSSPSGGTGAPPATGSYRSPASARSENRTPITRQAVPRPLMNASSSAGRTAGTWVATPSA